MFLSAGAGPKQPNAGNAWGGFSLIELLVVIAILLVIAATIPNYLRSRMAANESAAGQTARNVTTAAVLYHTTYGNGYSPDLGTLGGPPGVAASCDQAVLLDQLITTPLTLRAGTDMTMAASVPGWLNRPDAARRDTRNTS